MREVLEWIGKDDNAIPPKSVRARVFRKYEGRCYLSGRAIRAGEAWDLEHIKPLWSARPGENLNRESNLAPAIKSAHAEKTAAEAGQRAKSDRLHAKHHGYWPASKAKIKSRPFSPSRPTPRTEP